MTKPGNRFARGSRLRKGYHRRQVDTFLDEVELGLAGALPRPTATDVRRAGFELVHGGYRTEDVDIAMDALEERVLLALGGVRRGRVDVNAESENLRRTLSAPYRLRFVHVTRLRRGYDVGAVDDFVDATLAMLDGRQTMTVEDVRAARFRPRRGGYQEAAVDDLLDRVVELLLLRRHPTVAPDVALASGDGSGQDAPWATGPSSSRASPTHGPSGPRPRAS